MTNPNNKLTILSWNVNGLGSSVKCSKVFSHLNSLKGDILFLQETHLTGDREHKLKQSWISQVFHAPFNTKARGVAILFLHSREYNNRPKWQIYFALWLH